MSAADLAALARTPVLVVASGVKRVVTSPQPDWGLSPTAALFGSPASLLWLPLI